MTPADFVMLRAFKESEQRENSPPQLPISSHDFPLRSHKNNNFAMHSQWQKSSDAFVSHAASAIPPRSSLNRHHNSQHFPRKTLSPGGQLEGNFQPLRRKSSLQQLPVRLFEPTSSRLLTPSPSSPSSATHLHPLLLPSLLPPSLLPSPSPSPLQENNSPSPSSSIDTFESSPSRTPLQQEDLGFDHCDFEQNWQQIGPLRTKRKFLFKPAKRLPHHVDAVHKPQWQVHAVVDVGSAGRQWQAQFSEPVTRSTFLAQHQQDPSVENSKKVRGGEPRTVRFEDTGLFKSAEDTDAPHPYVSRNETSDSLTSSFSLSKFAFPFPPRQSWQGTFGHLAEPPPPVSPAQLHYSGVSFDLVNPHSSLVFGSKEFESPGEIDGLLDHYFDYKMSSPPVSPENPPSRVLYDNADSARRKIMGLEAVHQRHVGASEGEDHEEILRSPRQSDPFNLSITEHGHEAPVRRTYGNIDDVVENAYHQSVEDEDSSSSSGQSDVEIIVDRSETPDIRENCRDAEQYNTTQDFNNLESETTVTNLVAYYEHSEVATIGGIYDLFPEDSENPHMDRGIYRPPSPWPLLAQPINDGTDSLLTRVVTHPEAEKVISSSSSSIESRTLAPSCCCQSGILHQNVPPNSPASPEPDGLRHIQDHAYQGILLHALDLLGATDPQMDLRIPPSLPPPEPPILRTFDEAYGPIHSYTRNEADVPSSETYGNTGQLLNLTDQDDANELPETVATVDEPYIPFSGFTPYSDWPLFDDSSSPISSRTGTFIPRFPSFGSSGDDLESLVSASADEGNGAINPSPFIRMRTALSSSHGRGSSQGGIIRSSSVYDFDAHVDDTNDWETQAAMSQIDLYNPLVADDVSEMEEEVRLSEDSIANTSTYDAEDGLSMIFEESPVNPTKTRPECSTEDPIELHRSIGLPLQENHHSDQNDVAKVIQILKDKQLADELLLGPSKFDVAVTQVRAKSRDDMAQLEIIRRNNPPAHAAGIAAFAEIVNANNLWKSMPRLRASSCGQVQQQSKPSSLVKLNDAVEQTTQRDEPASESLFHGRKESLLPVSSNGPCAKLSISSMNTIRPVTIGVAAFEGITPLPLAIMNPLASQFHPAQVSRKPDGHEQIEFQSMGPKGLMIPASTSTYNATATADRDDLASGNDEAGENALTESRAALTLQAALTTPARAAMSGQTELRKLHLAKKHESGTDKIQQQRSNNSGHVRSSRDHSRHTVTSRLTDRDLVLAAPNWNMQPQTNIGGGGASGIILPYPTLQTNAQGSGRNNNNAGCTASWPLDETDSLSHKDLSKRWFLCCVVFPPVSLAYSLGAMDWIIRRESHGKFASFHPTCKQDAMTAFWAMLAVWFGLMALLFFLLLNH